MSKAAKGYGTPVSRTDPTSLPWLQIGFGKPVRVSQVELVAANQSLTNIEVRSRNNQF